MVLSDVDVERLSLSTTYFEKIGLTKMLRRAPGLCRAAILDWKRFADRILGGQNLPFSHGDNPRHTGYVFRVRNQFSRGHFKPFGGIGLDLPANDDAEWKLDVARKLAVVCSSTASRNFLQIRRWRQEVATTILLTFWYEDVSRTCCSTSSVVSQVSKMNSRASSPLRSL